MSTVHQFVNRYQRPDERRFSLEGCQKVAGGRSKAQTTGQQSNKSTPGTV